MHKHCMAAELAGSDETYARAPQSYKWRY
jgi:hypothetical protein